MKEHVYWPACEVRTAANGWMVRRAPDYSRDTVSSDDFYVFNSWHELSDFLQQATTAKRQE